MADRSVNKISIVSWCLCGQFLSPLLQPRSESGRRTK